MPKKIRKQTKILYELDWANTFNSTIADSTWLHNKSFSPGRYAVGYSFLYVLYRVLDTIKPEHIIEFGLGQSSNMLYRYADHFSNVDVKTFEHNPDWINFYSQTANMPLNAQIVQVESAKIIYKGFTTMSVKGFEGIVKGNKYDLILIDAPSASRRYSRPQILSLISENIDVNHFCIMVDDYNRFGEQETCKEVEDIFKKNKILFSRNVYEGIKDFVLYCSPDLDFLTTL